MIFSIRSGLLKVMIELQEKIERLTNLNPLDYPEDSIDTFLEFRDLLGKGKIRSAEYIEGEWKVNIWVKKGILLGFNLGKIVDYSENKSFRYFDKDTYPLKKLSIDDGIRIVPGGTSIREGAYVAKGVVIMPPAYVNVGAYVDEDTMIDSHALVGSCAQIGKNVHISAGTQIGGVLEPVRSLPVIIEDHVILGGNSGVYEGTIVHSGAVIAAGTVLTSATRIYDLVNERVISPNDQGIIELPKDAVVVPGVRKKDGKFAEKHNISIYSPIIVKYRDEKTKSSTNLEEILR